MNRINVICLGVKNMETSLRFYRDGLGFQTDEKEDNPHVVFFSTTGTKFELYPIQLLAQDVSEQPPTMLRQAQQPSLTDSQALHWLTMQKAKAK